MMIARSVVESFLGATQGSLNLGEQGETGTGSSSGGVYHEPGIANEILQPDAFKF